MLVTSGAGFVIRGCIETATMGKCTLNAILLQSIFLHLHFKSERRCLRCCRCCPRPQYQTDGCVLVSNYQMDGYGQKTKYGRIKNIPFIYDLKNYEIKFEEVNESS